MILSIADTGIPRAYFYYFFTLRLRY